MGNRDKIAIGLSVAFVIAVVSSIFLYVEHKENQLEKEVTKAYEDYYSYINEHSSIDYKDKLLSMFDFYKNANYSNNDVELEMKTFLEKSINSSLEYIVDSDYVTEGELMDIAHIAEGSFITDKNKALYEESIEIFKKYNKMVASKSSKEIEAIEKYAKTKIEIGMKSEEVVNRLGKPNKSVKSESSLGKINLWYYDRKIVYLKDNVVYKTVDF